MKIASVKEVKDKLSYYLKAAEKEDVIIMKNGRPTAVLHHLGDDDMEDIFWNMILSFVRRSRSAGKPIFGVAADLSKTF